MSETREKIKEIEEKLYEVIEYNFPPIYGSDLKDLQREVREVLYPNIESLIAERERKSILKLLNKVKFYLEHDDHPDLEIRQRFMELLADEANKLLKEVPNE